tara:strand:+ start:5243 stop:5671 length:429 start_codon:yes stop_codon:yes gene_type:complete
MVYLNKSFANYNPENILIFLNLGNMNKEIEQCALYLIQDTISGDYKIGISNNPGERKKEIRIEYNVGELKGISITWFLTRNEALYWEGKFHEKFKLWHSPARGGKEWFSLSSRQVNEFIEWMRSSTDDRNKKIEILKDILDS